MTLRVVELFAGIGAQASALERLGIPFTSTVCENDERTYQAYCAIHGDTPNLGDITKVEHLPSCDLLTYSFPCQDLSIAGAQAGMAEGSGTRSSLLWEVRRLLQDAKERNDLPEILLMENVEGLLHKANRPHFDRFVISLNELGYTSSYAVLNAKDYGIPQNRRRVFMVSALHRGRFVFPQGWELKLRLKDMLESDVDESYYLSEERIAKYERHRLRQEENGRGFGWKPLDPERERVTNAITRTPIRHATGIFIIERPKSEGQGEPGLDEGILWPNGATKEGYSVAYEGDGVKIYPDPSRENSGGTVQSQSTDALNTYRGCGCGVVVCGDLNDPRRYESANRVYSPEGEAPTIPTGAGGGHMPKIDVTTDRLRIRYLTERECLRLMGQRDEDIDRLFTAVPSRSARYRMAGNSIVVDVLVAIFKEIYVDNTFTQGGTKQTSLDGIE